MKAPGAPTTSRTRSQAASIARPPGAVADSGRGAQPIGSQPASVWRRIGFAGAWLALALSVPILAVIGMRSVLDVQATAPERQQVDPTAVDFQALVTPTPTLLVLYQDGAGTLASVALMVPAGVGSGGTVLLLPASTEVPSLAGVGAGSGDGRLLTLAELHAMDPNATGKAVEALLGISLPQVALIDGAAWAETVAPIGAVVIDSPDRLETTDAAGQPVVYEASRLALRPEDVGPYLGASRSGESPEAKLFRQDLVWTAWLDALAQMDDPGVGGGSRLFGSFGHDIANGIHDVTVVAGQASPAEGDGMARFQVLPGQLHAQVLDLVQFPVGAPGDDRWARVRLLDGRGDQAATLAAGRVIANEWAQLTVFGTADSFDHVANLVQFHGDEYRDHGERLAQALGGGVLVFAEDPTDVVDLTVVVGADFESDFSTPDDVVPRIITSVPESGTDDGG